MSGVWQRARWRIVWGVVAVGFTGVAVWSQLHHRVDADPAGAAGSGSRAAGRDPVNATRESAGSRPAGSTGSTGEGGSPVGLASRGSSGVGSVDAALAAVEASQRWLYLSDAEIAAGVSAIATVQAGPRLAAQTVAQVGSVRAELAGGEGRLWWLVRPLAWRIESSGGDSASVAVWAVTVLSLSGVAVPQSEFVTVTVDVERVDGRWLVAGVGEVAGPTPMAGPKDQPWDSVRFDGALGGFVRVGVEAGR